MDRLRVIVGIALLALAGAADACRGNRLFPESGQLDGWSVLEVEITGVHLTAYELHSLVERGAVEPPSSKDGIEYLYPTSSTPTFKVNLLVDRVLHGSSESAAEFNLGGCGIKVPQLREKGLIFVSPSGDRVGAVWASQEEAYERWIKELEPKLQKAES